MLKSVRKPSVAPVYAVGVTWLGYTLIFGLQSIWRVILCAAISVAVYLIMKATFPGKTVQVEVPEKAPDTGDPAVDETIVKGREAVKQIRLLNAKIPDAHISEQLGQIEAVTGKIFAQLEQRKDLVKRCRQFLDYYLPTTIKLMERYVQLQNQGVKDGNIASAMRQIEAMLDNVQLSFTKQLDSLFAADVVDITAEISVMEQMMQAQGLTDKEDF